MSEPAAQQGMTEEQRNIAAEELRFHQGRIASGSEIVTSIGNYIFILFGAGVVAATQVREAIVIVPLFWSAWMLHALQRGRDTIKHEVLARHLETRINESLGTPVLVWTSALTTGRFGTPFITTANFIYWTLLNLASWVMSVYVLWTEGHHWWAAVVSALGCMVYAVAGATALATKSFYEKCEVAAFAALGSGRQPE